VQLEGELRQAQAMEVAGRLSSSIAHDFNNLLTVIIGNLHLAQLKGPAHADLGAVEAAARRGAALARQLLSLSRPARMPSVGVDLPGAIRALEPSLRNALPSSIHFIVETCSERIHVGPDLVQIEQVLLNLLLNARDAMPAGGQLRVLADVVGEGEVRRARLVVTDSGIGMNDETLAHVFEPFFTTKPAGFGTGLGLATVRRIVAAAHGEVEIATTPGGGTSVTVLLPLVARDTAIPTREVTPATVAGRGRVLLVDDEPEIRRVLSSILSEFGFHVSSAANGMEALAILATDRAHIDVVVTDLTMPRLGGEGLCRQIAKFYPGLPTLCISGTHDSGASEGESWSGDRVILKPASFDELVSRIDEELASGASRG
jgi:CheY-like chemotaxis protein/two-component sensor histidine kinase